jgi:hypothetical protein
MTDGSSRQSIRCENHRRGHSRGVAGRDGHLRDRPTRARRRCGVSGQCAHATRLQLPNADAALRYGHGICDKVYAGRGYPHLIGDVKADFNTADEFQASYLISEAANELCPALIWQLRSSAAHYQPTPEAG